ncbi:MAG: hypothetical protein KGI89_17470, partial [Euryarchaeota archaeon]|nr:hypothetical protein [Euryarchaeota archaeon]
PETGEYLGLTILTILVLPTVVPRRVRHVKDLRERPERTGVDLPSRKSRRSRPKVLRKSDRPPDRERSGASDRGCRPNGCAPALGLP